MAEQVERLAVVENELKNVRAIVERLESKFDGAMSDFATKEQLKEAVDAVKSTRWRDGLLQLLAGGGVAGLLTYFFTKHG